MSPYMTSIQTLLAQTICESPRGYIIRELFSRFPSVPELMEVTEQELTLIKGVGPVKARQIIAALSLAKSLSVPQAERCIIRSPKDVADLLRPEIGYQQREHFVVLFLDTKNRLIAKETIAIGSLNACIVHPREVLKAAIKRSSATIVLSHNHPSGDTNPSQEDIQITTRLIDAGNIIGIEILDHVIVGLDRHYSLKENGHM